MPVLAADTSHEIRVVYHIDDARVGRFALHIAKDQLQTNPKMKIAMVAYADGVDFLLKGATDWDDKPYAPEVQELLQMGVQFKVCSATLRFRDIPKARVLDGLEFVPAGTYEVIRLQAEDGYVYLKP
jgi:intracellular sulfur oxidation DsrE/DsrF family protein